MAGLEHRLRVRGTARGRQPRWPPHLGTPPPPGPTPTHPPSWPPTLAVYWFLPPLKADSMSGRLRVPRRSAAQWGGWVEVQRGWGRMAGSGSCTIGWVGRGGGWRLRVPQRSAAQWGWGGGWLGSGGSPTESVREHALSRSRTRTGRGPGQGAGASAHTHDAAHLPQHSTASCNQKQGRLQWCPQLSPCPHCLLWLGSAPDREAVGSLTVCLNQLLSWPQM